MIRATLNSTMDYLGTTCTDTFKISKKNVTASVNVSSITVGETPKPVVSTESDGTVTFEYKSRSADDSAYTTTVPTSEGKYTVRATISETDMYLGITCTADFNISLKQAKDKELSVPSIYYGQTVNATFNTDSDGEVTIMYKPAAAPDTAYDKNAPTEVGNYVARATVTGTSSYEAISVTTSFSISYLDAPAPAFVPSGEEGKNGYYTSDVVLNAPSGYLISKTLGTGYTTSIPYTEGLSTIYLKRINDNALTGSITITQPKIDKTAPSMSSSSGTVFVDSMTLTVSDDNLVSLTVNGSPVTITNGTATITLTRPESGFITYTITAEDEAGNISTIEITLMAEWLKEKTIPEGNVVSLNAGEEYFLDEGKWIVSIVKEDGTIVEGTTIYSGNLPFYVSESGNYIFTRVETD